MKINERKSIGKERHRQYLTNMYALVERNEEDKRRSTLGEHCEYARNIHHSIILMIHSSCIYTVGRYVSYITAFTKFRYGLVETTKYTIF